MRNIWQDLRFAIRLLRSNPAFTAVAVLTLGLGIAANTTVFGWVETLLLRPIPGAAAPHELVALEGIAPDGGTFSGFPHPDFRDFQREMTQASGVIATHSGFFTIGPPDQPRRVLGEVRGRERAGVEAEARDFAAERVLACLVRPDAKGEGVGRDLGGDGDGQEEQGAFGEAAQGAAERGTGWGMACGAMTGGAGGAGVGTGCVYAIGIGRG
jgi:hypothetical protein